MNESAFLSALHDSPNDEVTWSALADWLEEFGQPDRAELARLVRRLRAVPVMERTPGRAALEDRAAALLLSGVRPVVPQFENSLGMRLALLPGGVFRMGSPPEEKQRERNERAHEVELTRPFYCGVFTVTQAQYGALTGESPSHFAPTGGGADKVKGLDTRDFPVERVTWADAVEFCRMLSERDAGRARPLTYRLPTEAEWEYACRGGSASTSPFYHGWSLSSTQANFNGNHPYGGAEKGPFLDRTCAVGSYFPNAFGLYDMHGNVSEWCADRFGSYGNAARRVDPRGPANRGEGVVRNGSAGDSGVTCRAAHRIAYGRPHPNSYLGFRVVADWPGAAPAARRRTRKGKS